MAGEVKSTEDDLQDDRVLALVRIADNPDLATRRRGVCRVWSDAEVTPTDGRLWSSLPALPGARALGFSFPHGSERSVDGSPSASFAWVTRRDALVIRDAIASRLGRSWVSRWRALSLGGVSDAEDRLPWRFSGTPEPAVSDDAISRLRAFAQDGLTAQPALAEAVCHLLLRYEFGSGIGRADRAILGVYADACGAGYGEAAVGEAISSLLLAVDRGMCLGALSVASESDWAERPSVCVDLAAVARSCEEAIATCRGDASPPRVTVSADVLLAIAYFARGVRDLASRLATPLGTSRVGAPLADLVALAVRGPIVGGPGAADAWGSAIEPFPPVSPSDPPPNASPDALASSAPPSPRDQGAVGE